MFALLPIIGGVLLGWLASRRVAVLVELVFVALASAVVVSTAPDHGASYREGLLLVPVIIVLSVAALWLGFWIARRRDAARTSTT